MEYTYAEWVKRCKDEVAQGTRIMHATICKCGGVMPVAQPTGILIPHWEDVKHCECGKMTSTEELEEAHGIRIFVGTSGKHKRAD